MIKYKLKYNRIQCKQIQ